MAEDVRVSKLGNTRRNLVKFFKEVKGELKKVIWPSRTQLINNTFTVLAACLIVGAIIWVADVSMQGLIDKFLARK